MIIFTRELLCECVQEAQPLLIAHHAEMEPGFPLDPDYEQYALLETLGRFAVFTGRDDGKLVCYSAFHLIRHMQSKGFAQAVNDLFYLTPEVRRGITALRFLRYCEDALKLEGAQQIVYFCSPHNNLAPILHRLQYADSQTMVAKML